MSGPKSYPQARDPKTGQYYRGKTAVKRAGLKAGQGIKDSREYTAPPKEKEKKGREDG